MIAFLLFDYEVAVTVFKYVLNGRATAPPPSGDPCPSSRSALAPTLLLNQAREQGPTEHPYLVVSANIQEYRQTLLGINPPQAWFRASFPTGMPMP